MTVTDHEPRKVVGTVNASEFFVAVAASLGFLTGADQLEENMPWAAVLGLIAGGVIVAPFAARLAGRMPQHVMGTLVGGLMLIVNGSVLGKAAGIPMTYGLALTASALLATAVVARRAYGFDLLERAKQRTREDAALAMDPLR